MKELLLSPFFLLSSGLFMLHQFAEKILNLHCLLLDSYLDCFLFFPIVLTLITLERRLFSKNKKYKLSLLEIIVITTSLSVFFEEVVPILFSQFTKDYYDYIAYTLGGLLFHFLINKRK